MAEKFMRTVGYKVEHAKDMPLKQGINAPKPTGHVFHHGLVRSVYRHPLGSDPHTSSRFTSVTRHTVGVRTQGHLATKQHLWLEQGEKHVVKQEHYSIHGPKTAAIVGGAAIAGVAGYEGYKHRDELKSKVSSFNHSVRSLGRKHTNSTMQVQ